MIDLYSRKVVGWSMALRHRIPKEGLVWHTDRGSQYASYEHRDLLK